MSATGELTVKNCRPGAREPGEEEREFGVSEEDDTEEPAVQATQVGATADPVKDYLKQIGKVPLLTAEQEVELAKSIEVGLFAQEKLNSGERLPPELRRELEIVRGPAHIGGSFNALSAGHHRPEPASRSSRLQPSSPGCSSTRAQRAVSNASARLAVLPGRASPEILALFSWS